MMIAGPYLTLPQRAVAACVVDGLGPQATAKALGCSESSAAKRMRRLRAIYRVENRMQLAVAVADHLRRYTWAPHPGPLSEQPEAQP